MSSHPPFGQADLTNCERELIHLPGSVQPHGVLLVLAEAPGSPVGSPDWRIVQATANASRLLSIPVERLLGRSPDALDGDLTEQIRLGLQELADERCVPLRCRLAGARLFEGAMHRHPGGGPLIVELEPVEGQPPEGEAIGLDAETLGRQLAQALTRVGSASSIGVLADITVRAVRDLTGYDRVMVYKFDPDGHGKVIAESRDPRLDSLLGHHFPASDIPQRARQLYLRNRVRVLVNVEYEPAPLVPRLAPGDGREVDLSLSFLRSMSPLHLQYLKNMGVTATLVVSLVREGGLWGLIAAHHYRPRNLRFALRAAADLLAEAVSTRIAAIETYAQAHVAVLTRRLQQRLVEATSSEGDWRLALFRHPRALLQPLEADGAALFQDDEILTAGESPSTPEPRALRAWVHQAHGPRPEAPFSCSSVGQSEPTLATLTPIASGVLAVRLSASRPDYLMWFRKEQLQTVTWAGDPHKVVVGNDPLELSPRRSFAAWSEIVRGTARPWTSVEVALARAFGTALAEVMVQVEAVRLLVAEQQLALTRALVGRSRQPVVVADRDGRVLFANDAFRATAEDRPIATLDDVARLFATGVSGRHPLQSLASTPQPWRGELQLLSATGNALEVMVQAEMVPARDGKPLGFVISLRDLSDRQHADAARRQLDEALGEIGAARDRAADPDGVLGLILGNANLSAMDIADASSEPSVATALKDVEASTRRAAMLLALTRPGRRA